MMSFGEWPEEYRRLQLASEPLDFTEDLAAITFYGAQERLAGGSATHCLETETFQLQLRDRVWG